MKSHARLSLLLLPLLLAGTGCGADATNGPAPTCSDAIKNGSESDVDCGGSCGGCDDGKGCAQAIDCKSALCLNGKCGKLPPTCQDQAQNGDETDVDCGGGLCGKCADAHKCKAAGDCTSGVCMSGFCQKASCSDTVKNGDETDVDCGGACTRCDNGKGCRAANDCKAGVCLNSVCAPGSCGDGVKNGDESDVDCGGMCPKCDTAKACGGAGDCKSGVCAGGQCSAPGCMDLIKNGDESDVDCGGSCPACDVGKACVKGGDCASGACINAACAAPSCFDTVKNGLESDVDCGGGLCLGCPPGKACGAPGDCASNICVGNVCLPPDCKDGVKNGNETDIDCGGRDCGKCPDKKGCTVGADCASLVCVAGACLPPTCNDGVKNQDETDIDCGGKLCTACGVQKACMGNGDCWNNACMGNKCGDTNVISVGVGQGVKFDVNGDGSRLVALDPNGNVTVDRQTSLLNIARYIYVANSGDGTLSKIDPNTQKEIARYCTAPGCNADPSRTSVSLDGDVGVANRANYFYNSVVHPERASAVKIAGDKSRCIDRNGNGKIDTFEGAGPVPAQFQWPVNSQVSPDECVLWFTPLIKDRNGAIVGGAGTLPRSGTFDSKANAQGGLSSNFYVGLYGTAELVQLDSITGAIKQQVAVGGQPYSSVFDRFSFLWIRDAATNRLIKVDTNVANLPATFVGPAMPCGYAISADRRGYVYAAGGACVTRIDPTAMAPAWETLALPNASSTRGPSLDANYNLWVPDTSYGAYHVDASAVWGKGMVLKKQIPLAPNGIQGNYILGTAIDGTGLPWIINTETNNLQLVAGQAGTLYRIDPNNNYAVTNLRVGTTPYVYSDLSGSQLALTAPTTGSYRKNFTAFCGSKATWKTLKWTDVVPAQTTVQVRYRAGKDLGTLASAPFVNVGTEPPALMQPVAIALPMGTDPSIFQVEFVIVTSDTAAKPTISSLTVDYSCP